MSRALNRLEWIDALISANTSGEIGNGELLTGVKLSGFMHWGGTALQRGYIPNRIEADLASVGLGRATYFKRVSCLKESGFLTVIAGRIVPTVPTD